MNKLSFLKIHLRFYVMPAILLVALGLLLAQPKEVRAQSTATIKGTVTEAETGKPLPEAGVTIAGTTMGTATEDDGSYAITGVPPGSYTLHVSFVGFITKEQKVIVSAGETLEVNFALEQKTTALGKLVVQDHTKATKLRESPFSVEVINTHKLANRGLTLNEAIDRATGVQVRRSGGFGSASVFHIRGLEGQRIQIYINGSPANFTGKAFSLNDIPLQLVKRIEVYKGIVPARFGGDGLGAAINIVMIDPEHGYFDASYTIGSYGLHRLSTVVQQSFDEIGLEAALTVNFDRAKNDYTMESPYVPGLMIKRDHDLFRRTLIGFRLSTERLWFDEVELELGYIDTDRQIQGIQTNIQHAEVHSKYFAVSLHAHRHGAMDGKLDIHLELLAVHNRSSLIDTSSVCYNFRGDSFPCPNGRGEIGFLPNNSNNHTYFYRHRAAFTYHLAPAHTINFTYVLDYTRYRPSDPLANRYAGHNVSEFPGNKFSAVVGLSYKWQLWDGKFVSVTGVRGYWIQSSGTPSNLIYPTSEPLPPVSNETLTFGASEAIRYRLSPSWLVNASVALARRLPSNTELFGNGLLILPSPALVPERSLNFNLGVQYDYTFADGRQLQVEVNGFWMNLDNMIRLKQAYAGFASYTNIGAVRIAGFDVEVKGDITSWLYGEISMTYQDARDVMRYRPGTTVPNPTYGLRLPNMPWLYGTLILETHFNELFEGSHQTRLFYEGNYTEEYFYAFKVSRRQHRIIPRAITHTIGIQHRWLDIGLTLSAEIQNVTDTRVINRFNHPLPGRTFRITLRYSWVGGED